MWKTNPPKKEQFPAWPACSSSSTAAAQLLNQMQGQWGTGRERGCDSVTIPLLGKAAASNHSVTRDISFVCLSRIPWIHAASSTQWKAPWRMLMLSHHRHILCPISPLVWWYWGGCDLSSSCHPAGDPAGGHSRSFDTHGNSMLRFKKAAPVWLG